MDCKDRVRLLYFQFNLVGEGHGVDEVLLEFGLQRGFDLVDILHRLFDFPAVIAVEQGHTGAGACGRCAASKSAIGSTSPARSWRPQ